MLFADSARQSSFRTAIFLQNLRVSVTLVLVHTQFAIQSSRNIMHLDDKYIMQVVRCRYKKEKYILKKSF
jgi:hypothetical protein